MSTMLKKKILELNSLTPEAFPVRPQNGFLGNITCAYPTIDRVDELVVELADIWRECQWSDDDVALLSDTSMIAIMAARLEMKGKPLLCELALKWLPMRNAPESVAACIVQSFYAMRITYKQIYAIRVAIWNYTTKPDLVPKCILKISETGKLILDCRNREEFDGNEVAEHVFLSAEYLKLTRNPLEVCFRPMAPYDYTQRREGELAEPISQRAAPLGYNPKNKANPDCFRDYFIPSLSRQSEIAEQIARNKRITWTQKTVDYMNMANVDDDEADSQTSESPSEESSGSETSEDSAVGNSDLSAEELLNFSIQQQHAIRVRE